MAQAGPWGRGFLNTVLRSLDEQECRAAGESRGFAVLCRVSAELFSISPCRDAKLVSPVAVSLRAGRAAQASASSWPGASASCRSGVVSEEGALLCVPGAWGLFSALLLCRGGTEVTAWPHPRGHRVPTRPMHTPSLFQWPRTLFLN